MDKPIQVGDLVQIVKIRECCPEHTGWGAVFRVSKLETYVDTHCSYCLRPHGPATVAFAEDGRAKATTRRLKRIPPPEELGIVDEKEDLREPA